jgi:translation initiation factor IF-3
MPTKEAIALAREQEKDLVEINPKANPPVTQITEFTRFKFQKEKEARKQKARTHVSEMKGIRLSIRIGPGDFETRIKQAEKFLNRGDKIKAEIILRGRDRAKVPDAYKVIEEFIQTINASIPTRTEQEPDRQGNKVTAIFAKK